MCQQNNCGCSQTTVTTTNCNSCPPETCTCPVKISTDCSTYTGDTLACSGIEKDTILTEVIQQLDGFICDTKDQLYNAFSLVNIGTGSQVYKGVDGIGRKELRTIKSISPDLTVTQTATEIQLDVDIPTIDGSETKVTAGTNTTVSGNGTTISPYVINSTLPDGTETKITAGTNVTVSGVGSTVSPYIINSTGGVTAPDATNLVKGILKLTNDLGGTADLPTTPTALHKTTNETFEGIKSSTNTTTPTTNGLALSNSGGSNSESIGISNNGAGRGLYIVNGSSTGEGFYSVNSGASVGIYAINNSTGRAITTQNFGTGYGIQSINNSSGHGVVSNSMPGAAGFNYIGQDNATDTFTVDKLGNIIANKYTKTGGTAQQILIADGTIRELNPQKEIIADYILTNADDGYVIFINNGTTPITVTINSSVTIPNFSVGFIQEGSADISFVGTGVSLTNPIGFKSKGQGYQTFIEKKLSTSTYYLLGNTRA